MYRLYLILKDRTDPPTDEELAIASGKKVLDTEIANSYYLGQAGTSANLLLMFAKQAQDNTVSYTVFCIVVQRLTILLGKGVRCGDV